MDQLKLFMILSLSCLFVAGQGLPDSQECRDCALVSCRKIEEGECEAGTVLDRCGCCPQCGKLNGEKCGGPDEKYGKCGNQLYCVPQNGGGLCAQCPPVKCSNICPNDLFAKDENGCNTCNCLCKPSNCLMIKCGYGLIESFDANGCKSCSCKEKPVCKNGDTKSILCNTCSCRNGFWICTQIACKTGVCYHEGKAFNNNDNRPAGDGCNTCSCEVHSKTELGTWHCTEKVCDACPNICARIICEFGVDKTTDENGCEICTCKPRPTCKDGDTKYILCNKCSCRNGVYICTKIGCLTGVCYHEGKAFNNNDNRPAGDGCNTCSCEVHSKSEPGTWHCTEKVCIKGCVHNNENFPVGAIRYELCNKCSCSAGGNWLCTKKGCPNGFCYFLGNQVAHGQSFFDGCNDCFCTARDKTKIGSISCTKRGCPGDCPTIFCQLKCSNGYVKDSNGCNTCKCKPAEPVYCKLNRKLFKVGEVRYENCNSCTCGKDGAWACTKKACLTGVCYVKGQPIKNGERFFDGCNFCTCRVRRNGIGSVACSRRYCGPCKKIFCPLRKVGKCKCGFILNSQGCASTCQCRTCPFCSFNGKKYRLGAVRYDQCNRCRCKKSGWACQSRKCRGGVCYYQRYKLKDGKSFFDGCNTCTCSAKDKKKIGTLACTEKACPNCRSNLYCRKLNCPNGRVVNKRGCEVCRCKKVKLCKSNCKKITKLCPDRVEKYTDFRGCTQCRCKADHAGFCPLFPAPPPGPNDCGLPENNPCQQDKCSKDTDCPVDKKCCVSGGVQGSPRDCITPWPTPFP